MSVSVIVGWVVLAGFAYWAYRRFKRERRETAEAEDLRAGLRARAEECRKVANACVFKDQYFSLAAKDTEQTNEEIEDHQRKAIAAEQEGRALMLGATVLEVVVKQPTRAKMIEVMQHYVLEFGQRNAQTTDPGVRRHFPRNVPQWDFGRDRAARRRLRRGLIGEVP